MNAADSAADADEVRRQRRQVDQRITMHAALRDRYRLQATSLRLIQLVASVIATAFAFADSGTAVTVLMVTASRATLLGWLAVLIFTATVVDLALDRAGAASRHHSAVRQLASLKAGYRAAPTVGREGAAHQRMTALYETTMDSIPPIPERDFLRLKAHHLLKVEASRFLSAYPGVTARKARRAVQKNVAFPKREQTRRVDP